MDGCVLLLHLHGSSIQMHSNSWRTSHLQRQLWFDVFLFFSWTDSKRINKYS
jgi:hypothetical protein